MAALPNDRWRAAVEARFLVTPGKGGNVEAARVAGFKAGKNLRKTAFRLFHDERVLAALHELGEQYLKTGVPDAIGVVREVLLDPATLPRDRLRAAEVFIARAHPVQTVQNINVIQRKEVTIAATQQVIEQIAELARKVGLDPAHQVKLIEGTAEEVKE
jgi:hypothetical protein